MIHSMVKHSKEGSEAEYASCWGQAEKAVTPVVKRRLARGKLLRGPGHLWHYVCRTGSDDWCGHFLFGKDF